MKKIILAALLLGLGGGTAKGQVSQPLANCAPVAGLVAYYPFDESQGNPQDASGQLGAGTFHNGGSWQPTGGHDGGGAVMLSGSQYLNLPLYWRPTRFTFSFWLKPTSLTNWSQITGAHIGWNGFLFHSSDDGKLYVGTDVATRIDLPTPGLVQLGQWQHFVFTFDNGTGIIYKNGVALAAPRTGMTLPQDWQGIELGVPANALYDELRVYDRPLAAQEVAALYRCSGAATYLPPARPNANSERNWTLERVFDENGNVVGESKQFADALGRPTQAQARNPASGQVFAAQTVYSSTGQAVLQTLAAPTNNQDFSYKENFIAAGGAAYGPANFEQGKANAPDAVDATTPGTLGYYFSKQNALEPLTPVTSYPYTLTEPYPGPAAAGVRRAAGPGDELRMGTGRELRSRTLPVRKEFDNYVALRPHFVPGSPNVTLEYQATKTVSINADGRETIAVTNKEGQLLVTCLSGPQYPAVSVSGFISAEPNNRFDSNAPAYQDVHIPAAGSQDVKFTMGSEAVYGGQVSIINLLTDAQQDYPIAGRNDGGEPELHVQLAPGFYRIRSLGGTQRLTYAAHYGEFSYTYYDEAGHAIATVAPGGVPGGQLNLLRNPGFEQAASAALPSTGWLYACTPSYASYTQPGGGPNNFPVSHGGQQYGVHWTGQSGGHSAYTYQQLQNLPNGLYTARAWVRNTSIDNNSANEVARLLVKEYSNTGAQLSANIPVTYAWGNWVQVQVTDIPVTNGQCKVGFWSISPRDEWITFDDVEFIRQPDGNPPTMVTRKTYDTAGHLLSTESTDEGRTDYVYARDGRLRFSQSPAQRPTGRFSYANYDEVGRIVETGEYTPAATTDVAFETHAAYDDRLTKASYLEAEAAVFQNSNGNQPNYNVSNASGSTDVGWLSNAGNYVRWAVAEKAGTYELQLRYSTGGTDVRTMQLLVNGTLVRDLLLPGTGDWNTFATLRTPVTLPAGTGNTVQIQVGGGSPGGVDLDYLQVVSTIFQEAESAEILNTYNWSPGTSQPSNVSTASGGSVVGFLVTPGDFVRFRVQVAQAGTYQLVLGYATGQSDTRTMSLLVNGQPATQLVLPSMGGWTNYTSSAAQAVTLQAGVNVIQVLYGSPDNGWVDLDWLSLTTTSPLAALAGPPSVHAIVEDRTRTGGLNVAKCSQRQQSWYDLPWNGTDAPLGSRTQQFVAGMLAKTQNDNTTSWYSYDELGRVAWIVQNVPALAGQTTKTIDYTYDFSGNILQTAYQKGQADSFYHYYTYDAAQRLAKVETSPDGTSRTLQAEHSYYLHGALKRTQLAGDLQGLDYTYTLDGALKNLNHLNQSLDPGHDSPRTTGLYKDLFALTLDYYGGDYRSRNLDVTLPAGTGVTTRYDGTIQGAAWRTAASPDVHRMSYSYDEKGQLLDARYGKLSIAGTTSTFQPAANNALREGGLSYDLNGNLQSLQRIDQNGQLGDNFSYVYKANTNQLKEVHTGSPSGATVLDYDYNEQGQPTRQRDEQGQRYFTYDAQGHTTGVYFDGAHQQPLVTFAYDDRGYRLSKTSSPQGSAAPASTTYYVRDLNGNVLASYEKATPWEPVQRTEVPLYGAGRLGTLTRLDDGTLDYRYELTDQLGSARVIFHRPTTRVYNATLEPGAASQEEQAFTNVATTRYVNNAGYNGSTAVARLGNTSGLESGPSKTLTVQKGDTITFSTYAWLTQALTNLTAPTPSLARRAAPFAGLSTLAMPLNSGPAASPLPELPVARANPFARLGVGLAFTFGARAATPAARLAESATSQALNGNGNARLHYVVRDASGRLVRDDYQYANARTPGTWQALQVGLRLQQGGTVTLSVETDGAASPDVYFDEVRIEHTGGLIVQEQHQYAYGSPLPGLSYTIGTKPYRHGFQGQFAEKDPELGLDSYEARNYASRLGRWLSPDPVPRVASPYVGMGNNPVSFADPDGKDIIVLNATNGAHGAGHMALLVQDRINGGWRLYSKNGTHWIGGVFGPSPPPIDSDGKRNHSANQNGEHFDSLKDFFTANAEFGEDASQYDRALYIRTTAVEDKVITQRTQGILREPYVVTWSSCQTMVQEAMAELNIGYFGGSGARGGAFPNANFGILRAQLQQLQQPSYSRLISSGFGQPRAFRDISGLIRSGIMKALMVNGIKPKNPKFR